MHPEMVQQIGNGRGRQKSISVVIKRGVGSGEAVRLLVADQEFGGINAGQLVQKQIHVFELGHGKFPVVWSTHARPKRFLSLYNATM